MHRAGGAWAIGDLDRSTNAISSQSGSNNLSAKLLAITKGSVMKPSPTTVCQAPNFTARGEERATTRFLSECAPSSPRASLAFSALAVVRALREMLGCFPCKLRLPQPSRCGDRGVAVVQSSRSQPS